MSIVQHDGLVREALAYIMDTLAEGHDVPLCKVLDEAGMRFNLSPLDAEKLSRLLADERQKLGHAQAGSGPTLGAQA